MIAGVSRTTARPAPVGSSSDDSRYRRFSPVALRSHEGPLTEPTAGAQPWLRERVKVPLSCPSLTRPEFRRDDGKQTFGSGQGMTQANLLQSEAAFGAACGDEDVNL